MNPFFRIILHPTHSECRIDPSAAAALAAIMKKALSLAKLCIGEATLFWERMHGIRSVSAERFDRFKPALLLGMMVSVACLQTV